MYIKQVKNTVVFWSVTVVFWANLDHFNNEQAIFNTQYLGIVFCQPPMIVYILLLLLHFKLYFFDNYVVPRELFTVQCRVYHRQEY